VLRQENDMLDETFTSDFKFHLMPQYLYLCIKKRRDINEELPVRT
jgi:hypothetical protein